MHCYKKGVSTVISTILLLLVVIAIIGMSFMFFSGLLNKSTSSSEGAITNTVTQLGKTFAIESSSGNEVYIRNTGKYDITKDDFTVFVNGLLIDKSKYEISGNTISKNGVGTLTFQVGVVSPGSTVEIRYGLLKTKFTVTGTTTVQCTRPGDCSHNICQQESCSAFGLCEYENAGSDVNCVSAICQHSECSGGLCQTSYLETDPLCTTNEACHTKGCSNGECVDTPLTGPDPSCSLAAQACKASSCTAGSCNYVNSNDASLCAHQTCRQETCMDGECDSTTYMADHSTDTGCTDPYWCVSGSCQLKTCSEQNGNVCTGNQICNGNLLLSDSNACCDVACNTNGLMSYYKFENNVNDISGNGYNGILMNYIANSGTINGATPVQGQVSGAYSFDGNDNINIGTTGLPTGTSARTVEAWFKLASYPSGSNERDIISYGSAVTNQAFVVGVTGPSEHIFFSQWGAIIEGPVISLNQWYHVVVTYDGTTQRIYLNGNTNPVASGSLAMSTSAAGIQIGNFVGSGIDRHFDGIIDEIRIYNRALTSTEISQSYQRGLNHQASDINSGLVGYWSLDNSANDVNMFVTGISNQALSFNGIGNYVQLPNNFWESQSFSIWFKLRPTSLSRTYELFERMSPFSGDSFRGYRLMIPLTGLPNWNANIYNPPNSISISSAIAVKDGLWHHCVAIINRVDASTITTSLYVDNNFAGSSTKSVGSYNHDDSLILGDDSASGAEEHFDGLIDNFRIYNRALTTAEISYLYATQQ